MCLIESMHADSHKNSIRLALNLIKRNDLFILDISVIRIDKISVIRIDKILSRLFVRVFLSVALFKKYQKKSAFH